MTNPLAGLTGPLAGLLAGTKAGPGAAGKGSAPAGAAAPVAFPATLAAFLTPLGSFGALVQGKIGGETDADGGDGDALDAQATDAQLAAALSASNSQLAGVILGGANNPAQGQGGAALERAVLDSTASGRDTTVPAAELARLTAAARAARGPVDPSEVQRGLNLLDPVFRSKLERVIERMQKEFGSQVEVVETYRAPARQAMLYAQGRTQPGPVVTWTRSSNHTRGLAADLMVDGSYNSPAAYARLARVASEEGLHTLGPRDPGHVELPGAGSDVPDLPLPTAPAVTNASQASGVAAIAQVAQVAPVAPVAAVAQVAQVAVPGSAAAPVAASRQPAERSPERRSDDASHHEGASSDASTSQLAEMSAPTPRLAGGAAPATPAMAPMGADALDRVHRVLDLRETAATRPLSSVVLRVDNPNGTRDRVRISLRGASVGTTVDLGSRAEIHPLASRVGELQQALGRHGLESESVRVRAASAPTDAADLARVAAALGSRGAAAATAQTPQSGGNPLPQRDGQNAYTPDRGSSQPHSDHPRQRSGKERRGEPNS